MAKFWLSLALVAFAALSASGHGHSHDHEDDGMQAAKHRWSRAANQVRKLGCLKIATC